MLDARRAMPPARCVWSAREGGKRCGECCRDFACESVYVASVPATAARCYQILCVRCAQASVVAASCRAVAPFAKKDFRYAFERRRLIISEAESRGGAGDCAQACRD